MTAQQTVRAQVDQTEFFKNIQYMFAGSSVFLSEVLQNGRRAGATRIDLTFEEESSTLTVADDGIGISDFSVLLKFSRTGWDQAVVHEDRPFGMGVFSYFHVAKEVVFSSRGRRVAVTEADIAQSRALSVDPDTNAPAVGTQVVFRSLNDKLFGGGRTRTESLLTSLQSVAKGFPIPVFFNGQEVERRLAESAIPCLESACGQVSFGPRGEGLAHCAFPALFIQGLPIGNDGARTFPVVHLDSQQFRAVMPDRKALFNHQLELKRIIDAIKASARLYIRAQRHSMSEEDFALRYWVTAFELGGLDDLLCTLDVIPRSLFQSFDEVTADSDALDHRYGEKLLHRRDFAGAVLKAWIDGPTYSNESLEAPVLLAMAVAQEILNLPSRWVPAGHWMHEYAPRCEDLDIRWEMEEPGSFIRVPTDGDDVQAQACAAIAVTVESTRQAKFRAEHRFTDSAVVVPIEGSHTREDGLDAFIDFSEELLLVCVPLGASQTPEYVFSDFRDENECFQDEWAEAAGRQWRDAYAMLRGEDSLGQAVQTLFARAEVRFSMSSELVIVQAEQRWNSFAMRWQDPSLVSQSLDDGVLSRIAACLDGVSVEALKDALVQALRPGRQRVEDEADALLYAAGVSVGHSADGWHLRMPSGELRTLLVGSDARAAQSVAAREAAKMVVQVSCEFERITVAQFESRAWPDRVNAVRAAWNKQPA